MAVAMRSAGLAASSFLSRSRRPLHCSRMVSEKYYPDYEHAYTMYNLPAMKNRKVKFGIAVFGSVAMGAMLPVVAVCFAQRKAKGG